MTEDEIDEIVSASNRAATLNLVRKLFKLFKGENGVELLNSFCVFIHIYSKQIDDPDLIDGFIYTLKHIDLSKYDLNS